MKFLELGEGASVEDLQFNRNIMIVDDISKVSTFISVGKNGRILRLTADGNEVHTPESYSQKLNSDRSEFFDAIVKLNEDIDGIANELVKQRIKNSLQEASRQENSLDGECRFKRILSELYVISKDAGIAVLASCIATYIGYVPAL